MSEPWYLDSKIELPLIFPDQSSLKKVLPYDKFWLLLNSGSINRGETVNDPPIFAEAYASFSARRLAGHFGVVPNPLLVMAIGETCLLLSALLSISKTGERYAGIFSSWEKIKMEMVNVHAGETVKIRAWLVGEPTYEGSPDHPTAIHGQLQGWVNVLQRVNDNFNVVRVVTVEGNMKFKSWPKQGMFNGKKER